MKQKVGYWEKRFLNDKAKSINASEKYISGKLKKYYTEAAKEIEDDIEEFYEKYAKEEKITLAEARKRMSEADARKVNFEKLARETAELKNKYGKDIPEAAAKQIEEQEKLLNAFSKKGRVTRLENLHASIDQEILKLYDKQQMTMYDILKDGYEDGYYRSIYKVHQNIGIATDFTRVNEKAVRQAVMAKHGKANFSERIYGHCKNLSEDIKENLTVGIIRGESVDKMAKRISKRLNVSMSDAKRLVRTETAYIHEQATLDGYKEAGITSYQYMATLDGRTSEICQELDGKTFLVEDAVPGTNLPPMHPNCRSTTVPVFDEEDEEVITERAARDADGSTYKVPGDMTYEQWYNGLEETEKEKYRLNNKKADNYYKDKEQYEGYKQSLEKHAPKSFKDFQKIKYADGEEYGILKAKAKGMQYYNEAHEKEPEITELVKSVAAEAKMGLAGLEWRIKRKDTYLEKIERKYSAAGNKFEIKDIIRYTMIGIPEELSQKTLEVIAKFESKGYTLVKLKNTWVDKENPYNGINVTLKDPDGQCFEIQFHTSESYMVKDKMHKDYETWRKMDKSTEEAKKLRREMFEQSQNMKIPDGIEKVR